MKTCVNILHLTDLHLVPGEPLNQRVVLDAALKHLADFRGTDLQPDLLVFSGDLVRSADEAEAYDGVLDILLSVAGSLGLSEDRVVLAPGNHDVSRTTVGPRLPELMAWRKAAQERDGANQLLKDGAFTTYIHKAFSDYQAIATIFSQSAHLHSGFGYSTYFYRELGIAVVSINTALLSAGGLAPGMSDQGQLAVPEATLLAAFSGLPEGTHILVVGHHPTTWLNEANADLVETLLAQNADAYLCGHLHAARPKTVFALSGSCYMGQSGALFENRDRWNGLALYSLVPGQPHVRAHYRRWFEERRAFSKAEDLADEGIAYSTPAAIEFFSQLRPPLNRQLLEQWRCGTLLPNLTAECNQSLSPIPLENSFVAPDFVRETPATKDTVEKMGPKVEIVTFDKAVSSGSNYLISAPGQSGKTTALRQWALTLARADAREADWSIPILIKFSDVREYPSHIETLITRRLVGLPAGIKLDMLLDQGALTLFVDDFEFKSHAKAKALGEFMSKHPKCRYVLTTAAPIIDSAAWEPVITPELPFTHVRLRPLRRRQLLSLIQGHGVADPHQADQLLERVTREAASLNVPLTAVTGTFLIQVFSTEPNRVLVNQATLVERYIELLLQKFTRPDVELKSFDFKLKRDLLSVIAAHMARTGNYEPLYNDVLKCVIEYVKHYGFPQAADQIVTHFVVCRILEKFESDEGERLRFPLATFLNYFVASRMIEDVEFREWVLDPIRYLSFMDEVSFYAALVRNDKKLIQLVFGDFSTLSDQMWVDASEEVKSGLFMDEFSEPHPEASEEELFAIQEVVKSNQETDAERQHMLEDPVGPSEVQQTINRPEFSTVGDRWYAQLLLVSAVLKHMELIPDAEKRALLKVALKGWLQFCTFSLSLVPQIARDKTVKINGVVYRLIMSGDAPIGEISRRISLSMPLAVSYIATSQLGSEKLKIQLADGVGSDKLAPSEQLMRALLLADIGVDEIAEILKKASEGVRGHRYLSAVLARKLYDVAIRFRLNDESVENIRTLASDLFVKLEGSSKPQLAQSRKNQIVKSLRDQRIMSRISEKD